MNEAKHYKKLYEDAKGILDEQLKDIEVSLSEDGLSAEAKLEFRDAKDELQKRITEIEGAEKEGPAEDVTLESLGVKGKGEKAEALFQKLVDKGLDPKEAAEDFKDWEDKNDNGVDDAKEKGKGDGKGEDKEDKEEEGEDDKKEGEGDDKKEEEEDEEGEKGGGKKKFVNFDKGSDDEGGRKGPPRGAVQWKF